MRFLLLLPLFAFACCTLGCDSKPTTHAGAAEAGASKEIQWDWKSFQKSSELVLGTLPLDIQPKQSLAIKSEASGIMTFEVTEKVSQVTKGQVIARMDVETLAEQGERLTIQEQKQTLEGMKRDNLDTPEKRKKAKDELEEARRKVKLIEMILKNPAMENMSQDLFGSDIGKINSASLADAKSSLRLAEQKMAWADEFDKKLQTGAERLEEMDFSKSKRLYQEAKDHSVYTAPFAGELRLDVNYVQGQTEYTVGSRETIATLSDYDEINALLNVSNATWINLQPQRLHISLTDKDRTIMSFIDDRVEKDEKTMREQRKYVFSVPLKNNESLKRLAGTQMNGDLIYKLPSECYIIPKYDLALYALGKTDTSDWTVMVKKLWPTASVVAQGQKFLAVSNPAVP